MLSAYVKFCGGCNPMYDRGDAVSKLKKLFEDKITFYSYEVGIPRDIGIVVQGCERECVQIGNLAPAEHMVMLRYESDLADAITMLHTILAE